MDKRKIEQIRQQYDLIIHTTENANIEFWYARELMPLLGYGRWENFDKTICRATESCDTSGITVQDHFRKITKMITVGKGDQALFGGFTTQEMKNRLGVNSSRPLADFLPTLTIAAKNLATEMTNYNVEEKDLQGERSITGEHIQNNRSVRDMLGQRGIKPENLPPSEDIKKLERRVKSQEKKIAVQAGKLPDA